MKTFSLVSSHMKADLLLEADEVHDSILILIDLSLAFDLVDQHVLTCPLQNCVGISDLAVDWSHRSSSGKVTPPPLVLLLFVGSPMVLPWVPIYFYLHATS